MRHGILMMAHNNTAVVKTAMRMLDDARFTFFLLIDAKSPLQTEAFLPKLEHARCVVLDRMTVNWAGYSLIQGELRLVEAAMEAGMEYLHLFCGADLPLKTPEEIDRFCERYAGQNFINLQPGKEAFAAYKAVYKHYFVDTPGYRTNKALKLARYILVSIQKALRAPEGTYYHGSGLFSITAEFARYVLDREAEIERQYRYALAGDEVFLQTLILNSPYAETLWEHGAGCRLIDWTRAEGNSPHTFTMDDLEELRAAMEEEGLLFARKFSETRDLRIVQEVEQMVLGREEALH